MKIKVAPLLRLAADVDVAAETFVSKIERLKLQLRKGTDPSAMRQSITEDVSCLPEFVLEDPQLGPLARHCLPDALTNASLGDLNEIRDRLAPQMKNKRRVNTLLTLDLPDYIAMQGYIILAQSGEHVYVAEYRRRVEQRILNLVAGHPTIQAIQRGEAVDDWQLFELERTLQNELGGKDLELSPEIIRKAYGLKVDSFLGFIRQMLEIEDLPDYQELVRRQFESYTTQHLFNADQIRFLRVV